MVATWINASICQDFPPKLHEINTTCYPSERLIKINQWKTGTNSFIILVIKIRWKQITDWITLEWVIIVRYIEKEYP